MAQNAPGVSHAKVGGQVTVEEIKVEPPQMGEVRIKMLCASICHTDVLACKGFPTPLFPRVPGHEGVGMIESVGKDVGGGLKPGDIVMPLYLGECGECLNCKTGKTNLCHTYPQPFSGLMNDGTSRMSIAKTGERLYHFTSCSTWSEYAVVTSTMCLSWTPRCLSPMLVFFHVASPLAGSPSREAQVHKGSTVAVFGLGTVGLGVINGSKVQGASKIIGVDINNQKEAKGKLFGMTDFINPKDHPNKSTSGLVKDITHGLGVDYCFECTGVLSLLNEVLDASKFGIGTVVPIGAGGGPNVAINSLTLFSGRTLKFTSFGGIRTRSDLPIILKKCLNKEIELDELLTHEIHLDNIQEAFEILKKPDCLKILINF